jgi:hypothetical protein
MQNFKPISQVLAALLLAVFCFSDMPLVHVFGWLFLLLAFDLLLDVIIKAVKKE